MNWSDALTKTITEFTSFEYGASDCCQFASRYIEHKTGEPSLADKFFSYDDKQSAHAIIDDCTSLVGVVTVCLGKPIPGNPEPGDVAVLQGEDEDTVAVYTGDWFICVDMTRRELGRAIVPDSAICARWIV